MTQPELTHTRRPFWSCGAIVVVVIVSLAAAFLAGMVPIHAADYFTHMALGRHIVEHGVPTAEPFLAPPTQGRDLIAFEWLAEVVLYRAYRLWGHSGMQVAKGAVSAALFLLVLLIARRRGASWPVAAAIMLWAVLVGQHRLLARPHLISWLVIAAVYYLLHLRWSMRVTLPVLVVAAVLSANLHGSAVIAVGVTGLFGLSLVVTPESSGLARRVERRRGWWLMAAAVIMMAASLINPRGLSLLTYPFRPVDAAAVRSVVEEWRPMVWVADRWPFWLMVPVVLVAPWASWAIGKRRPTLMAIVLPVGLVVLSIWMRRFALLLAMLGAPLLAGQVSIIVATWRQHRPRVAGVVSGGLWLVWFAATAGMLGLGGDVRQPGWGTIWSMYPVKAADWIASQAELTGTLFTEYHFGGYAHWTLHPHGCQALIDGRTWDYPRKLFEDHAPMRQTRPGWDRLMDAYGVDIRLERWRPPPPTQPGTNRYVHPDWTMVYWDDQDVVLLRNVPRFRSVAARYACGSTFPRAIFDRLGLKVSGATDRGVVLGLARQLEARVGSGDGGDMARLAWARVLIELGQTQRAAGVLAPTTGFEGVTHRDWAWLCGLHLLSQRPDRAVVAANRYVALAAGATSKRRAIRLLVASAMGAGDVARVRTALDHYLRLGPADDWSRRISGSLPGA